MNKTIENESKRRALWQIAGIVFIVFIIAINAFLAFSTIQTLSKNQIRMNNTTDIIMRLKNLHHAVSNAESGKRGYLLTDEEEFLAPYKQALINLDQKIASVGEIKTEIPGQERKIKQLIELVDRKIIEIKKVVRLAKKERNHSAMKIVMNTEGRSLYVDINALFGEIEAREFQFKETLAEEMQSAQKESQILFFSFLGISCFLLTIFLIAQRKNIEKEKEYNYALAEKANQLEQKVSERTQEILLYSQELSRSNQELEDFAFVASHDLQEPLRKIRAFSSRLQQLYHDKLGDKGSDYLSRLEKAATRMSSLIEDLLNFSRIKTRGKDFEPVDLNKLIEDVIDDLEVAIEESKTKISKESLPTIKADPSQISQLFLNILSNAVKFRKPDTHPEITIRYRTIEEYLHDEQIEFHEIRIQDNGIGIDASFNEKIFLPFQRLHGRDDFKGNGIGLAVCKKIVERHGGRISVNSEPEKGAEFIILIPELTINPNQI